VQRLHHASAAIADILAAIEQVVLYIVTLYGTNITYE